MDSKSSDLKRWTFSLWTFWVLTTIAYGITFAGPEGKGVPAQINSVFGFFTPMWLFSFIGSLADKKWIVVYPVFALGLIFGDLVGKQIGERYIWRSLYNFAALVTITLAMDMIIWGDWRSLTVLMRGLHLD